MLIPIRKPIPLKQENGFYCLNENEEPKIILISSNSVDKMNVNFRDRLSERPAVQ